MPRNLEPPTAVPDFVEDMRAFSAEPKAIKGNEIAARQPQVSTALLVEPLGQVGNQGMFTGGIGAVALGTKFLSCGQ